MFTTVLPTRDGRNDVPRSDDQRPIPRRDRADDADRLAVEFDPSLVVVLEHLDRHRDVGGVVGPGLHAAEFEPRAHAVERLALLLGQKPGQFLGVFADFLSRGMTQRATLGVGHFRPFGERRARCRDCAIEIGRCGHWC